MSDAAPAPEAKPKRSLMVPIFLGLNSVLLAAVLVVMLTRHAPAPATGGGEAAGHAAEAPAGEGGHEGGAAPLQTLKLPDLVVHLRNPEVDRYARVTFEIDVISEKDKEAVTAQLPRIRESILSYLSDRTVDDLRGSEGIDTMKTAIGARLATLIPSPRPRGIYVTDLVVQ